MVFIGSVYISKTKTTDEERQSAWILVYFKLLLLCCAVYRPVFSSVSAYVRFCLASASDRGWIVLQG